MVDSAEGLAINISVSPRKKDGIGPVGTSHPTPPPVSQRPGESQRGAWGPLSSESGEVRGTFLPQLSRNCFCTVPWMMGRLPISLRLVLTPLSQQKKRTCR